MFIFCGQRIENYWFFYSRFFVLFDDLIGCLPNRRGVLVLENDLIGFSNLKIDIKDLHLYKNFIGLKNKPIKKVIESLF
jgi:hypothetical protein